MVRTHCSDGRRDESWLDGTSEHFQDIDSPRYKVFTAPREGFRRPHNALQLEHFTLRSSAALDRPTHTGLGHTVQEAAAMHHTCPSQRAGLATLQRTHAAFADDHDAQLCP